MGPIGVRYSIETAISFSEADLKSVIERDFATIKKMGLDTVCLRHCPTGQTKSVMDSITACGLNAIVDDPIAIRYVRSGSRSRSLFSSNGDFWIAPVVTARYIGLVVDDVTLKRAVLFALKPQEKKL